MQDLLDAYLEHLRSERQLSSHTLIGYRHDLSKLVGARQRAAAAHGRTPAHARAI